MATITQSSDQKPSLCILYCFFWLFKKWKKDLNKNLTRRKHILAMETVSHCSSESHYLLQYVSNSEDKKAVIATIRICLLISEKNLSFNLIDWLIPTLKASFPDSLILEKVMMSRTKCGNIIRFGKYYTSWHLYFSNSLH